MARVIEIRQRCQKKKYDKVRTQGKKYKVGQHVLMLSNKVSNDGKSHKLEPRYTKPFVVTRVFVYDRYLISELPGSRRDTGICSSDRIEPFVTTVSSEESSAKES